MEWNDYKIAYTKMAKEENIPGETIKVNLDYALTLFEKNIPIIYDVSHLSLLIGIKEEYIYKITNSPKSGYRKFQIPKRTEGFRTIYEPLPNLKIIQKWIQNNILDNIKVSVFAKAYRKNTNLKDNIRFHKGQKIVLKIDLEDFFGNLKQKGILKFFRDLGYTLELSVVLAKLCTINGSLPQGAPTSPSLSNILMKDFDEKISEYCKTNRIRYTRYADDLTFSGDFDVKILYSEIKKNLSILRLKINIKKTIVMKQHNRQLVTGIVVNQNQKVLKEYRHKIRQEIYYINKYGVEEHLKYTKQDQDIKRYLKSLKGKINYCLFIDSHDLKMQSYLRTVQCYLDEMR